MRTLLELAPLLFFFAAYQQTDIYLATAVLMVTTSAAMGVIYLMDKRLTQMQLILLGSVLVFGSITLILQNELFIKWKLTVIDAALALMFWYQTFVRKSNIVKTFLGHLLELPDPVWQRLSLAWIGFFLVTALGNAVAAAFFSTDVWVAFKVWGTLVLMALFIVAQGFYIAPYMPAEEESKQ
jgi:intracellular septation protein